MANKSVKNSSTGTMGIDAAKRSRFEKSEIAYGKIPAAAYVTTDVLQFTQIPAKEIISARFVTSNGVELEVFNKTDVSTTVPWTITGGTTRDINYYIVYIRGTGKAHPGLANASSEVAGEQGVFLQVAVTVTA